jgi:hypothetical protein
MYDSQVFRLAKVSVCSDGQLCEQLDEVQRRDSTFVASPQQQREAWKKKGGQRASLAGAGPCCFVGLW